MATADTRCAVLVEFEIAEGRMDAFADLVAEQAALSLGLEPACLTFDVCSDPDKPDRVVLYEVYRTRADFDAHLVTTHFRSFDGASAGMVCSKSVRILEIREP